MKIYESLYIFSRYEQDIRYLMELIIDFGYNKKGQNDWTAKETSHYQTIYNTILMDACSYLDEYNKNFLHNAENEFHDRIKAVKKIARPAFKKVSEWTDLRSYRNQMVAHNFRIDGNDFSFKKLGQYKAPRTYLDIVMLRKHLMMIHGIIAAEFQEELRSINDFLNTFPVQEQQIDYSNVKADLLSVLDEINTLCENNSKPYKLSIELFVRL
jgi:hypothetical protein